MNRFMQLFKTLGEKWKGLSSNKKVGIILGSSLVLAILILSLTYLTRTTYTTLFTDLNESDQAKIYQTLKDQKVDVKISGSSLLVPKDKVDEIRMSVFSNGSLPSTPKGFELFDQSQFGLTDTQAQVMYQRALEGSLAQTIDSLDAVQSSTVHLVLPDDSIFADQNTQQAKASITIKLKDYATLTPDQVKAIVSMVSASVKNLPKQNVEIIDSNMKYLTDGLYDDNNPDGTVSNSKQQEYEKQFESNLQSNIKDMLTSLFGDSKVKVAVNANLNFDSSESTTITYDPKDVVLRSTQSTKSASNDSTGGSTNPAGITSNLPSSGSSFPGQTTNTGQSSSTNNDNTIINNEIGQTEVKTVKAPGQVTSISTSVLIDGTLSDGEKTEIRNIVAAATGYSASRGDQINISALPFNQDKANQVKQDLEAMKAKELAAQKTRTYTLVGEIAGGVILLMVLFLLLRKKKSKASPVMGELPADGTQSIDVLVGDEVISRQPVAYKPVLEDEDDSMTLDKEIKDYATKKPEQVVDVIKSWLSEDER